MTKKHICLSLITAFILGMLPVGAFAELALPSSIDRRPDLSLDPFKRARESLRTLPAPKPTAEPVIAEPSFDSVKKNKSAATQAQTHFLDQESNEAFSYNLSTTMDALSLVDGGIINTSSETPSLKKTGVLGVIDLIAKIDTGAAKLWSNGQLFFYSTLTFGKGPTTGDLHGVSNINAGGNTMRIVELWYTHRFPYSHSSVIFGMHDFNRDFYVAQYGRVFMNAGFSMGQVIRAAGGPSRYRYPVTTLGLRLKSAVTQNSYFQIAMYDGKASDSEFDQILAPKLSKKDGVFLATEGGIFKNKRGHADGYYKIAAGAWYLRADQKGFNNPFGKPIFENNPKSGTGGVYFLAEKSIGKNAGLFFKYGKGPADYLQYNQFMAGGLNYTGAIPGRDADVLGLGFVRTKNSPAYLSQLTNHNQEYRAETTFELTYTAQITRWLMIQPDYQFIQYPSMKTDILRASIIGVRVKAAF